MSASLTDRELIARMATGDEAALLQLVARHEPGLARYLRARLLDLALIDDVLQETFLAAWRSAAAFRGTDSAKGWLYGMARRLAARTWRRRAGEPSTFEPLSHLGREAGWGHDNPELAVQRAEDASRLHAALHALDPDDREVLILRDLEGLTGPEAAKALDLSLAALKSRLHRARLRLMAQLRAEGGADVL